MTDVDASTDRMLAAEVLAEAERRLVEIVGRGSVARDVGTLVAYSNDATPLLRGRPEIVCSPATTAEVSAVVTLAAELEIPW